MERLSTQTVFSILDHCKKWLRKKHRQISAVNRRPEQTDKLKLRERDYGAIDAFVNAVSQKKLADASYHCQAYARSLMHLESHIVSSADGFETNTFALQCVYTALQEVDYISGIAALRSNHPSFEELVFRHQAIGNFQVGLPECRFRDLNKINLKLCCVIKCIYL
jgi:serine/threonine-protein kinase ATR